MLKKGLFAAALIVAIVVLAYEPAVLAAAAESTEQIEENDGFLRVILNILSVATLAFLAFLTITDKG